VKRHGSRRSLGRTISGRKKEGACSLFSFIQEKRNYSFSEGEVVKTSDYAIFRKVNLQRKKGKEGKFRLL